MPDLFKNTPIYRGFKTDADKENNGVWRYHESGVAVRIRRSNRVEHKKALRKFYRPYSHLNTVDPSIELEVKMKAGAQELIADWAAVELDENDRPVDGEDGEPKRTPLEDGEGNQIRPTEENVLAAFREQPDFFTWVTEEADTFEHYRVAAVEGSAKNSPRSSAGSGSGGTPPQPHSSNEEQHEESTSLPYSKNQS